MKNLFELALPNGWISLRVGDAGRLQLGRQRSPKHHNGTHMRPYLRVANVFEARIDTESVYEMNFSPEEYETYKLNPGDLLLNEGQSKELVGRPAIYRGEVPGACFTNSLIRFHPEDGVLPEWALATFRLYLHAGVFQSVAKWTTNIAHLSANRLSGLPFRVPPPAEQQRIVDAIDSYVSRLDAAMASLKRVQAKLKAYRASVLKAAVEGRLVPTEAELARKEKRTYEPADALLARILKDRRRRREEAELAKLTAAGKAPQDDGWKSKYEEPAAPDTATWPELPDGWRWATVEQVGEVLLGRQRSPDYLTGKWPRPYLRVANIKDDRIDLSDVAEMDFDETHFPKYRLLPGDVLVSEGQSPHLVGQSAIYRGQIEGLCFQKTLHRFRSVAGGPRPEFAQIVFRANVMLGIYKAMAPITTNIAHLTLEKFKTSRFPLPPGEEQDRIILEVERLLSVADAAESQVVTESRRIARLRQSVLRWAFEGKLVDQDPDDEPAEKLLARVRAERAANVPAKNPRGSKPLAAQ